MEIRKDVADLEDNEIEKFVNALWDLKKRPSSGKHPKNLPKPTNRYDDFVMMHITSFSEQDQNLMVAHQASTFLPWHRFYLRRLEKEIQKNPDYKEVTIPYWDWTNQKSNEKVWSSKLLGGNGRESDGRVMDGPFAYDAGWTLYHIPNPPEYLKDYERPDLCRRFGLYQINGQNIPISMPTEQDVLNALSTDPYDTIEWNRKAKPSFRNILEGWYGAGNIHNVVHIYVGGQVSETVKENGQETEINKYIGTMSSGASPNDPCFWFHHANIDRIWADWQLEDKHWALDYKGYLPQTERPGLNVTDPMLPWLGAFTPANAANFYTMGYKYMKYIRPNTKDKQQVLVKPNFTDKNENIIELAKPDLNLFRIKDLKENDDNLSFEFVDNSFDVLVKNLRQPFQIQ
jgi:tyrosinase